MEGSRELGKARTEERKKKGTKERGSEGGPGRRGKKGVEEGSELG